MKEAARTQLSKRLGWLAGQLEGRDYLMGSQFTVADGYLFTVLGWASFVQFDLAVQVRRLLRMVDSLSAGSVERRLASVMVDLAERAGEPFPGGILIPLRLRRSDLASLAATTLESASRKISVWRRAGLVILEPIGYLIRDLDALRRLAGRG